MSAKRKVEGKGEELEIVLTKTPLHFVLYSLIKNARLQIFYLSKLRFSICRLFLTVSLFLFFLFLLLLHFVTCLLSLFLLSLFSIHCSKLGGGVLLIEILYRVSMGIVNFVERERKTARVNG